jgi:hypothetical protein
MPENSQSDLSFQPATQGYSFSASPTPPADPTKPQLDQTQKKKKNFFPALLLGFILLIIVAMSLLILDYFKVISLSALMPYKITNLIRATQPANANYNTKTGFWTIDGTFYQYDNEKIKVRMGYLKIMDFVYTANSYYLTPDTQAQKHLLLSFKTGTLFDLDQKANLEKKVRIEYKKENNVNNIIRITLY